MRVELTTALALAAALVSMPALGQTLNPGPPGPFVIDIRGATAGLPTSSAMYPVPPAPTTTSSTQTSSTSTSSTTLIVPTRGFGFDAGAHVYLFGLGPARIGIGANVVWARGTTSDAEATMDMVVPQLSFNFGTANGWSYLSGGIGPARVKTTETFNTHSVNKALPTSGPASSGW